MVCFANAFDLQDWGALRACLVPEIFVDYRQTVLWTRGTPGIHGAFRSR